MLHVTLRLQLLLLFLSSAGQYTPKLTNPLCSRLCSTVRSHGTKIYVQTSPRVKLTSLKKDPSSDVIPHLRLFSLLSDWFHMNQKKNGCNWEFSWFHTTYFSHGLSDLWDVPSLFSFHRKTHFCPSRAHQKISAAAETLHPTVTLVFFFHQINIYLSYLTDLCMWVFKSVVILLSIIGFRPLILWSACWGF